MSDRILQQKPGGRDYVQESQGTVSGGGGGLVAKLGGSRNASILGAGATVALVALLSLRKNKAAGGSPADPAAYDSSLNDLYNQWQQEYEQLQQEIAAGGQNSASGPGTPPVKTPLPSPVPIPKPPLPTPAPRPPKNGPGIPFPVTVPKHGPAARR